MRVFEFESYKRYVNARISSLPKKGRGEFRRISSALKMHTTLVSQIFRGEAKNLSFEQACELCEYLGLTDLETDYFLKLVQMERAGTERSRKLLRKQLAALRAQAEQVASRLPQRKELTDAERAIFYSSWRYSAVRLATSIKGLHSIDQIAERFMISKAEARAIVDFLLATGLCIEKDGEIHMGPKNTHTEAGSPLAVRHHTNWRLRAVQRIEKLGPQELAFTAPVSIAKKDMAKIRARILEMIEDVAKTVKASEPEQLACLSIDWIEV
jgi:uncharacterized protein (TIGR02147 family)